MWKSTSELGYSSGHGDDVASMAWKLHAIEQTQLRRKYRVDGVGRPKFDFQIGAYVDATAGAVAKYGGKGCRYDQDVEALARAAGLRVVRSERFGGGFFGSFELAPVPR